MAESGEYGGAIPDDLEDLKNVDHAPSPQVGDLLTVTAVDANGRVHWEAAPGGSGASGAEWITLFDLSTETDLSKFVATGDAGWSIAAHVITWNGGSASAGTLKLDLSAAGFVDTHLLLALAFTAECRITAPLASGSLADLLVQDASNKVTFSDDGNAQSDWTGATAVAVPNNWYQINQWAYSSVNPYERGQVVPLDAVPVFGGGVLAQHSIDKAMTADVTDADGTLGFQIRNLVVSALSMTVPVAP